MNIRKLSFKELLALVGSIFGLIGSCFGAYMYLEDNYVPRELYETHRTSGEAVLRSKMVEIDLGLAELELDMLLKIEDSKLTPNEKHRIQVLTAKVVFLENHLYDGDPTIGNQ